jgi:hypothetical protein
MKGNRRIAAFRRTALNDTYPPSTVMLSCNRYAVAALRPALRRKHIDRLTVRQTQPPVFNLSVLLPPYSPCAPRPGG